MTGLIRLVTVAVGVHLAVRDTPADAARGGRPVVLLHGLASTNRWWDLVAEQLSGQRLIRFDHRGHGQSSTPPRGYTVTCFAADTAAVLDALDAGPCVVAGHSFGAAVALELAARRPDLVGGVCLVDGGVYDPRRMFGPSWWEARYRMLLDRRIAPTPDMLAAWARGSGLPDAAVPALQANYQPAHAAHAGPAGPVRLRLAVQHEIEAACSLWCHEPAALLTQLRCPTVAVLARPADPAAAATHLKALLHTFDRAGRTVPVRWVDGGHDLPLERPADVAAAITHLTTTGAVLADRVAAA
ncbi:alpha/beta fold hydrolase [Dactylosporangium darangshiense]|uniref:AB hydrolase-1 domain-containing protein n=1 Tax=Dactylosporangium darangshiense TaxID=579108 RepID=A0ABP8DVI1_9ACTN